MALVRTALPKKNAPAASGWAIYVDGVPTFFWYDAPELHEPEATWLAPLGHRVCVAGYVGPWPLREPLSAQSLLKAVETAALFPLEFRP